MKAAILEREIPILGWVGGWVGDERAINIETSINRQRQLATEPREDTDMGFVTPVLIGGGGVGIGSTYTTPYPDHLVSRM